MFNMIKYNSHHWLLFIRGKWRVRVARLIKVSHATLRWIVWAVIKYLTSLVSGSFLSRCLEKVNLASFLWLKAVTLILCWVSIRISLHKLSASRQSWKMGVKYCSTRFFFLARLLYTMMIMHIVLPNKANVLPVLRWVTNASRKQAEHLYAGYNIYTQPAGNVWFSETISRKWRYVNIIHDLSWIVKIN